MEKNFFFKLAVWGLVFLFVFQPLAPIFAQDLPKNPTPIAAENPVPPGIVPVDTPIVTDTPEIPVDAPAVDDTATTAVVTDMPTADGTLDRTKSEIGQEKNAAAASTISNNGNPNASQVTTIDQNQSLPRVEGNTGALIYDYPISIPLGRNGFSPALSLKYNSQNLKNDSIFGYGWEISIPYIERVNKHGTDQLYAGTYNDFYSLQDGELIQISGSTYGARVDEGLFNKYNFSGNVWTVTGKDGTVYKYGQSAASRQDNPANADQVYKWMLDSITDTNGNIITYAYTKDNGQIYPDTISYGDIYQIKFSKESRQDIYASYKPAFLTKTTFRISGIQVLINGQISKNYTLNYSNNPTTSRSRLSGVVVQAGAITLPATTFNYQLESDKGFDITTVNFGLNLSDSNAPKGLVPTDVNGDGYSDFIKSYEWTTYPGYSTKFVSIFDAKTNLWQENDVWRNFGSIVFYLNSIWGGRTVDAQIMDVNGDMKPDLISKGYPQSAPEDRQLNNGNGWINTENWRSAITTIGGTKFLGDINGDGLPDFWGSDNLKYWGAGNGGYQWDYRVSYNTGSDFNNTYTNCFSSDQTTSNNPFCTPPYDRFFFAADINSDGLTDLVKSNNVKSCTAISCQEKQTKEIYLNTGTGWVLDASYTFPDVSYFSLSSTGSESYRNIIFSDVNNDGYADIVISGGIQAPDRWSSMDVYINNGHSWLLDPNWYNWGLRNSSEQQLMPTEIDGNGSLDFLNNVNYVSRNKNRNQVDLLSSVTLPAGGTVSITYKPSAQYKDVSGNLLNPSLPLIVQTVNTITSRDSVNNVSGTTNYEYSDGAYYYNNAFDRKFAGFSKITQNDALGNVTKTYFHTQDGYFKIGKSYKTEIYDNTGRLFKVQINKWDNVGLAGGAGFVKLSQAVEQDFDGQSGHRDKAESYVYDNTTGNLTQKTEWGEVQGNDDGTFSDIGNDKITTDLSYASNPISNVLSAKSLVVVSDQTGKKIKESRFYYDNLALGQILQGNQTATESWIRDSSYARTEKTYNSYGLVTKSTDANKNATVFAYDSYNLYPAKITNPLGQFESYLYDYNCGKSSQLTDANGFVFKTNYDGFCRSKEEWQPEESSGSLVLKAAYFYTDSPLGVSIQKTDYLDAVNQVNSWQYFDGLGRLIQTKKSAESPNYATLDYAYDSNGNLQKESLPYFSLQSSKTPATGQALLYSVYAYDALGRKTLAQNAVGQTSSVYVNWQTTVTDANNKKKDFGYDAFGNLVFVNEYFDGEPYATIYSYDPANNLVKITDALGNTRSFEYNGLDQKLYAQDLHSPADTTFGAWRYSYDNNGNLLIAVDPAGQTILSAYDSLNRKTTEDFLKQPGTEFTYMYDTCQNGKGKLCYVKYSNGSLDSYKYSPLGLQSKVGRAVSGRSFATSYSYDRQGNKTIIFNPDNSQIKYDYNQAGLVEKLWRKESTDSAFKGVVDDFDYSPSGQVAKIAYSNGAVTQNGYKENKLYWLDRKTTTANAAILQNLSYDYDNTGNITQITDTAQTPAKVSVFEYDDLYRLIASTVTGSKDQTYIQHFAYDILGNITWQQSAGKDSLYYYGESFNPKNAPYANPHAVTMIATQGVTLSKFFAYDNAGNVTSDGSSSYTFDFANRLAKTVTQDAALTYDYDYQNQRIKSQTTTPLSTQTTYYPSQDYNVTYTSTQAGPVTQTKHIFANGQDVATIQGTGANATAYYNIQDHQNSTAITLDKTGNIAETTDYYPYGQIRQNTAKQANPEQRKYIGQEYDAASGLSYLNARYYNGVVGRFLSEDPVFWGRQKLVDPQSLNSYSYAQNNPVTLSDPSGLEAYYIPGTSMPWAKPETSNSSNSQRILSWLGGATNQSVEFLSWSGRDNGITRSEIAQQMANHIIENYNNNHNPIDIFGYSHGGNDALAVKQILQDKNIPIRNLILSGTPIQGRIDPSGVENFINAYSNGDWVQILGGNQISFGGLFFSYADNSQETKAGIQFTRPIDNKNRCEVGVAGRTISGVDNINVTSEAKSWNGFNVHFNMINDRVLQSISKKIEK